VTNGGKPCAEGTAGLGVLQDAPPPVMVARVTGAGDTFMAAHIVAERDGADRATALARALRAAATYVSGEIGS
jgi:sugar/nucleoside kinase (ribokinase family)